MNFLSDEDTLVATRQGWQLCDVYDLKTSRWVVGVLPTPNNPTKSAHAAELALVGRAREGDGVARRAIQAIMTMAAAPAPKAAAKPKGKKK